MKKFVFGAIAAVVTTISLAPTAEAGWHGHHHGWHNGWNGGVFFGGPRIVIRPAYVYNDYCYVKKIRRYDDWGNVYIRRVRVCG